MYIPQEYPPSEERAIKFDMIAPMLESAHKEMSELSKKKQDGVLNELKVRYINRLLTEAQNALGNDPSLVFVEILNEDELPQNSDAVLVLGQWQAAMNQFKERHYGMAPGTYYERWFTVENPHPSTIKYDEDGESDEDDL